MPVTFLQDIRYAIRGWRARPVFAIVAIVTIAVGVGVNTTVFSLLEALVLRPLPAVDHADRVVLTKGNPFSQHTYTLLVDRARAFERVGAWQQFSFSLVADGEALRVRSIAVTASYFDVLGVTALRGRLLTEADESTPQEPAVVLSARFWRTRFGRVPDIVGRRVMINRVPVTIVGVAAEDFNGTDLAYPADLYVPVTSVVRFLSPGASAARFTRPEGHWLRAMGRMRPGMSFALAQADIDRTAAEIARDLPAFKLTTLPLLSLNESAFPGFARQDARTALLILLAIAACVLIIACANVANLLLARAESRHAEFGIRLAIGAGPRRLAAQLLTETLLLAVVGFAAAMVATRWTVSALSAVQFTAFVPVWLAGTVDRRVLAIAVGLLVVTTAACGLWPAWHAAATPAVALINRTPSADRRPRLLLGRDLLVLIQVAASMVLVIGAMLFVVTLRNQQGLSPGFDTNGIVWMRLDAGVAGYSREGGADLYRRVTDRLRVLPDVTAVTRAINEPLGGGLFVRIVSRPGDSGTIRSGATVVAPGYFQTLGIPIVDGADFDERSPAGSVIVNETLAKRLWPGRRAVGEAIEARDVGAPFSRVIGVARDSRYETLQETASPFVYSHLADDYDATEVLFVRTSGDVRPLASAMRAAVRQIDPMLPIVDLARMDDHVSSSLSQARAMAGLTATFAVLAGMLAAIGLYGVLSCLVAARTREMAIRIALGATRARVMLAVMGRTSVVVGAGVVVGIGCSLASGHVIATLLYGVTPASPGVLLAAAIAAVAVGAIAAVVPARRIMRIEPVQALRE